MKKPVAIHTGKGIDGYYGAKDEKGNPLSLKHQLMDCLTGNLIYFGYQVIVPVEIAGTFGFSKELIFG